MVSQLEVTEPGAPVTVQVAATRSAYPYGVAVLMAAPPPRQAAVADAEPGDDGPSTRRRPG
jgi:hypothetical protein